MLYVLNAVMITCGGTDVITFTAFVTPSAFTASFTLRRSGNEFPSAYSRGRGVSTNLDPCDACCRPVRIIHFWPHGRKWTGSCFAWQLGILQTSGEAPSMFFRNNNRLCNASVPLGVLYIGRCCRELLCQTTAIGLHKVPWIKSRRWMSQGTPGRPTNSIMDGSSSDSDSSSRASEPEVTHTPSGYPKKPWI